MVSPNQCYVTSDGRWDTSRLSKFERSQGLQDIRLNFRIVAPDNEALKTEFDASFSVLETLCSGNAKYRGESTGNGAFLDRVEKTIKMTHKVFAVSSHLFPKFISG
jgi:hypothetical protein